ncbi:MAG: pitrilysin family protein [Candidatus Pacebacteria bacterium]|nr:pitrilysin family protein [Candidatus Paceibacterota bacterium]
MYKYNITELDNGLKIITVPNKKVNSFFLRILVKTGSEYETFKTQGISHILEHMIFKGTKSRTYKDISQTVDKLGGVFNASTGNLLTDYFLKISKKHQDLALEILSDIYLNSTFPKQELQKEKGSILSELIMCQEDGIYRTALPIMESFFGKENPAGWETIGTMESINQVTQANLKKYVKDHYTASNTLILVAGNFDEEDVIKKLKNLFKNISCLNSKKKKPVKFLNQSQELIVKKSKHQESFLTISFPSFDINSDKLYMLKFIENLLVNKGLSSRLYNAIREERGLVYRIMYHNENSLDYGLIFLSFPADAKNIPTCLEVTLQELSDIKENGLKQDEFNDCFLNITGKIDLLNDNFYESAYNIANEIALTNTYITPKEKLEKYKAIKKEDIDTFIKELFDFNKMKVCVDGDFSKQAMKKELSQIINKYSK